MRSKLSKGFLGLLVLGIHMHIQAQPYQTQQIQPDQTQQALATQAQPDQAQQTQSDQAQQAQPDQAQQTQPDQTQQAQPDQVQQTQPDQTQQTQPDQVQQTQPDQTQQTQATQGQSAQTQQAQPAPLPPGTIDKMVATINGFRATLNLPPLQRWTDGESCANQSAQVDAQQNKSHFSFENGQCPGVLAQNTCPGWPSLDSITQDQPNFLSCLHSMWNEGPPPSTPCTGACFSAHGHFIIMSNPEYTKVAIGIFQMPNGKFWINMNFQ